MSSEESVRSIVQSQVFERKNKTMSSVPQTIVLCMIVKDESPVILRSLQSVRHIVHKYCICDTGSTDGTQALIREYFKKEKLDGKVYEAKWVDFAHNRNIAFAHAQSAGADYIMTLDADEVICPYREGKACTEEVTCLPDFKGVDRVEFKTLLGNIIYNRRQFFRSALPWIWKYPIHEICTCSEAKTSLFLPDICNVPRSDGARSRNPQKYLQDAQALEKFIVTHPTDSRAWFYLAQSYRDAGQPLKAVSIIDEALKHSKWVEEKYVLHLRKGRYLEQGKAPIEQCILAYLEAYNSRPTRAEALTSLVNIYRQQDKFHLGILFGEVLLKQKPSQDILFVEPETWRWKDNLSVCYYWVGRYQEAWQLTSELLQPNGIPEAQRPRVQKNHNYSVIRLT